MGKYKIYIDDNFHYMDKEYRLTFGEYDDYEEALKICQQIVEVSVCELFEAAIPADGLYKRYVTFGSDPFISPMPEDKSFSAWEYAKKYAKLLVKARGVN